MTDLAPAVSPAVAVERDARRVRLGDIGIARENLRHGEPPDDDIPTLAATMRAAGQLQPLTVRPGRRRKEERWMALDGRRRRLALGLLLDAGEIDEDHPVDVFVETDPARQAAAVLLTNTAVPVHVADVIAAIGRMLKSRLTVSVIARALGYAEIEIKRLSVLAGLPSAALVALKAGRITLAQARLLARLPDKAEQQELAEAAMDGHGFQDWRIRERLDESRITVRDRRCALVDQPVYIAAGGRVEADLFGEMAPVLLDPEILTDLWLRRARGIAAVFEAEDVAVHVAAGPEPDLPEDLEALGYVYGGSLPSEEMSRYRAQREVFTSRAEAVRAALADGVRPDVVDLAIVDMIHARVAADQTGAGGRLVTTIVMWPAADTGVEVRCYTPEALETEEEVTDDASSPGLPAPPVYVAPEVEAPEPDTEGVNHALHAVRTDVATRGLIRALADDPAVALTALIARLFTVLVVRDRIARSDAALAVLATGFNPAGGRVIEGLDGEVRRRLDDRRAAWERSGETAIGWIHGLEPDDRMRLLAELTAVSLDLREDKTTLIRRGARADAAELAELCDAEITRHWTPDATFLAHHPKGLLTAMLRTMGSDGLQVDTLRKTELVDVVAEQAAVRKWAPQVLSWKSPAVVEPSEAAAPDAREGGPDPAGPDDGVGAYEVTRQGEDVLSHAAE